MRKASHSMKEHFELQVTLLLEGPILTVGGESGEPGVDAPMARDRLGRYMLPYSLIKGKALEALKELGTPEGWRKSWLGDYAGEEGIASERGRLRFSDFATDNMGKPGNTINRIQIDASTGTVGRGMLQMIEAPFDYGEQVAFVGNIHFIADVREAEEVTERLQDAMRYVSSFGALRTVGFGRTKDVQFHLKRCVPSYKTSTLPNYSSPDKDPLGISIELQLDRPLCIVGRNHSSNHFESESTITGTILKGCVARLLQEVEGSPRGDVTAIKNSKRFPNLCREFGELQFTEATPRDSASSKKPVVPPLSLVVSPNRPKQFFDVALDDAPQLIYSENDSHQKQGAAPAFAADWKGKDFELILGTFGWPNIRRERRVRTAIDSTLGRAADSQLFSYGLVLPEFRRRDGSLERLIWESCIILPPEMKNRSDVVKELQELLQFGLPNLGKTRATAAVRWLDTATPPAVGTRAHLDDLKNGDEVVVTLQTECLMTDPRILQDLDTRGISELASAYEDYWTEVSDNSMSLSNEKFFARQVLHGGFVSRRHGGTYRPYLLTDKGSVFVLRIDKVESARELLREWQVCGLPDVAWLSEHFGDQSRPEQPEQPLWQFCPYIRSNGFGQVALNLAVHFDHRIG